MSPSEMTVAPPLTTPSLQGPLPSSYHSVCAPHPGSTFSGHGDPLVCFLGAQSLGGLLHD